MSVRGKEAVPLYIKSVHTPSRVCVNNIMFIEPLFLVFIFHYFPYYIDFIIIIIIIIYFISFFTLHTWNLVYLKNPPEKRIIRRTTHKTTSNT